MSIELNFMIASKQIRVLYLIFITTPLLPYSVKPKSSKISHIPPSRIFAGLRLQASKRARCPQHPLAVRGGSESSADRSPARPKTRKISDTAVPEWLDRLAEANTSWGGGSGDDLLDRWLPTIDEWAGASEEANLTDLLAGLEKAGDAEGDGDGDAEGDAEGDEEGDEEALERRVAALEAGVMEARRLAEEHMRDCEECRAADGERAARRTRFFARDRTSLEAARAPAAPRT